MNWLEELKKQLQLRREKLFLGIESAKKERDHAPSAIESHSDTTRSEKEKLIYALENDLQKLDEIILSVPNNLNNLDDSLIVSDWRYVEISLAGNILNIYIVPEGIGGEIIKDTRLLSGITPLGKIILGKKMGEKFIFNGQEGKIVKIF